MSVGNTTDAFGKVTDEGIERMRLRIGYAYPNNPLWNEWATIDGIRHFSEGMGDSNPLFNDPAYGARTRWGAMIAPPLFYHSMGVNIAPPMPKEVKENSKGALAGVHMFQGGGEWEWFKPVKVNDRLLRYATLSDVVEKQSTFSGGRSAVSYRLHLYLNDKTNEMVVRQKEWFIHVEREGSKQNKEKRSNYKPPFYSDQELKEIEETYDSFQPRGAQPRWWEETNVGDKIGPAVKGPFLITDLLAFHMGFGWLGYELKPLDLAYQRRKRTPNFFNRNKFNAWDTVQRVHWDDEWAKEIGAEGSYDYGLTRAAWVSHVLASWIGDDAWLWKMTVKTKGFNYIGDTTWFEGEVIDKDVIDGRPAVRVLLHARNQRNEKTLETEATILLPSTKYGPVRLPEPPKDLDLDWGKASR